MDRECLRLPPMGSRVDTGERLNGNNDLSVFLMCSWVSFAKEQQLLCQ